jgi:dihydromethanopterin reductase (acceptor)
MTENRIAWAITGAGHMLEECIEVLLLCGKVDLFFSRAGEEVLRMYALGSRVQTPDVRIYRENKASAPLVGRFFSGVYSVLVIAPATSNSVAKFVHGISDTLVTNLFAQAGKSRVPVVVLPTDLKPEEISSGPHRESVPVFPRPVDLENTGRLIAFPGVVVATGRQELERALAPYRK